MNKKPLLQWMDEADPESVPIMMAGASSTTASYFGIPERNAKGSLITPDMILRCSQETGIHFQINLGQLTIFDAIEFMDEIEMNRKENNSAEVTRRSTTISTPKGDLSEIFEIPINAPAMWVTHLVKSEKDLPAFAYLIEHATKTIVEDRRVRQKVIAKLRAETQKWPKHVTLLVTIGIPTFELMSNLYIGATEAFYLLADYTALMERLFDISARALPVWVECAAAAGADFVLGAINGLELFSPNIYERYFVPQSRALHDLVHTRGMRAWIHTCGYMRRLIHMGVYERMAVDILESFSSPPLGDVIDLREARTQLGHNMVTRGALNVDLFYDHDLADIRNRTRMVLEDIRGYRHMIGDTNDSYPPYPRENILAMLDEVKKSGRMLPA